MFIGILYSAAQSEYDAELISTQINSMKECIDQAGKFLTLQEINEFSTGTIKLLLESNKRKQKNEKYMNDQDVEDEEKDLYKLEKDSEEDLHVAIADLIGTLFKTHSDLCTELSQYIYTNFLPDVLQESASPKMHKFGIFLVDDMVEHMGYQRLSAQWDELLGAMLKFCTSKFCYVRQAAVYGLGIFAINTPTDKFHRGSEVVMALQTAFNVPKQDDQTEKAYGHCQANCLASIGKVLKYQSQSLGENLGKCFNYWIYQLPIKFDKEEAKPQHKFFAEMIISQTNLIIQQPQDIIQALKIVGEIVDSKYLDKSDKPLIK